MIILYHGAFWQFFVIMYVDYLNILIISTVFIGIYTMISHYSNYIQLTT